MKGILVYYSSTGNTRLACQYIKASLKNIELDLVDLKKTRITDFSAYDLAGFAAWADYTGPSALVLDYLAGLPKQEGLPAFVFNTFGMFNGGTLRTLYNRVKNAGFNVVSAFALHCPENIPIVISQGLDWAGAPNKKELDKFNAAIADLDRTLLEIKDGRKVSGRVRFGLADYLTVFPRTTAKKKMGEKYTDRELCNRCGLCQANCPGSAIKLDPYPVFDQSKCSGCWACYNTCPRQAIYTKRFKGKWHYPAPLPALREKLAPTGPPAPAN
jgi:ferredoxin/flavodoxin